MEYLNPMNRLLEDQKRMGRTWEALNDHLNELREIRSEIYKTDPSKFSEGRFERDEEERDKSLGQIKVLRDHLDSIEDAILSAEEDDYNSHKAAVLWYVRSYKPGATIPGIIEKYNSGYWSFYDLSEEGIKIAITDLLAERKIEMSGGVLRV